MSARGFLMMSSTKAIHAALRLILFYVVLMRAPSVAQEGPLVWRWSNPKPHGNHIYDFASQGSLVVQVAEWGQMYTSEDLDRWMPQQTGTDHHLRSLTFFNDRIVATGAEGIVVCGSPTERFQSIDLHTQDWLEGVTSSPDTAVAVGDRGAVFTSDNGRDWQRHEQGFDDWMRSVAYGGGRFVAVGENGFVAWSTDGVVWQPATSGTTSHLNDIAWINDHFVAVGKTGLVISSPNGAEWALLSPGTRNDLRTVCGNETTLLVAGTSAVFRRDGDVWHDEIRSVGTGFPAPDWTYYSSLWDGTLFLLGGRSGLVLEGFPTQEISGLVWVDRYRSIRSWLWDVVRMPDYYVVCGDRGTLMTSEDGIDWTLEFTPEPLQDSIFLGVGGRPNLLVVVGNGGSAMISQNGVTWESVAVPTENDLQGVALFQGTTFISGGDGTILASEDGRNWTSRPTPSREFLSSLAASPSNMVAVGTGGTILTSEDGRSWNLRSQDTNRWIYRVRFLEDRFVAVGEEGLLLTSPDGEEWTARASGTIEWLNDVTRVAGNFYAAGLQGVIVSSADGASWSPAPSITSKALFAMAEHQGQLITVGVEGAILRSQILPDSTPIRIEEYAHLDGENLFLFSGKPDQRFSLDQSEDLKSWTAGPVLEFANGEGALLHVQPTPGAGRTFFRAYSE